MGVDRPSSLSEKGTIVCLNVNVQRNYREENEGEGEGITQKGKQWRGRGMT
jgi:hypothetical protein